MTGNFAPKYDAKEELVWYDIAVIIYVPNSKKYGRMNHMKRILSLVLLACLLFCGCETATNAPTEPITDPAQKTEKVTVYLLEKSVLYDSGYCIG